MPIYQVWNPRIKAWIKYKLGKKGYSFLDVKEMEPKKPFRGVPKKGNRR